MLGFRAGLGRRLKWGIAGCGRFSETAILPALGLIPKARVMSLYSRDSNRVKALSDKFSVPHTFTDFKEFLASDIEAVYIGSTNADHYRQVIEAAEAGKHILCDKPLAVSSVQAREMMEACDKNGVLFTVNYVYRYHPLVEKCEELIANQRLGKLISINAHFNILLQPDDNFRFNKELSGGGPNRDLATHIVDMFRYLGGECTPVFGKLDNIVFQSSVEDTAIGIVALERGGYGTFTVSYNAPKAFNRIEVIGSKGALALDNIVSSRYASSKMTIMLEGEAKKAFRKRVNKLNRLLRNVNASFLAGKQPMITGYDGVKNLEILEQLEKF